MNVSDRPSTCSGVLSSSDVRVRLRAEIPAAEKWAYFDHAAVSPIPRAAAAAGIQLLQQTAESGDIHWPDWSASASRLRLAAAELLHCTTPEIALLPNTTAGINLIANAFPWFGDRNGIHGGAKNDGLGSERPNVVVVENEFSSNLLAWENLANYGVEVRKLRVDESGIVSLDRLRELLDSRTKLVSISWVNYLTGYRIDLAKVCELVHGAGAQLFLDAIQGLGVFPCDLSSIPVDYVAADGHKWMLGPEGAAILAIREERLSQLAPGMLGWNSLRAAHQFSNQGYDFKKDASIYEGGSANHLGIVTFEKSLRLLLDLGCNQPDNGVANAVLENAEHIQESLQSVGAQVHRDVVSARNADTLLSGILTFSLPGVDPVAVRSELIKNQIVCSVRHNRVRIATHAYNDAADIEKLKGVLLRIL